MAMGGGIQRNSGTELKLYLGCTGSTFRIMCNYDQNIGLLPLVLIVSQEQAMLRKFQAKPSRIGQDI